MPDRSTGGFSGGKGLLQFAERLRTMRRFDRIGINSENIAGGCIIGKIIIEAGQCPGWVIRIDGADRFPEFDDVRNTGTRFFVADIPYQNRRMIFQFRNQLLYHRNVAEDIVHLMVPSMKLFFDTGNQFEPVFMNLIHSGTDARHVRCVLSGAAVPCQSVKMNRIEAGIGNAFQVFVFHAALPCGIDADRHERFAIDYEPLMFVKCDRLGGNTLLRTNLNLISR